jgi:hypothetical protein
MKAKRLAHRPKFYSMVVKLYEVTTESTNNKFARDLMVAEPIRPRKSPECTVLVERIQKRTLDIRVASRNSHSSPGIRVLYLSA